jgi:hypothetical protein
MVTQLAGVWHLGDSSSHAAAEADAGRGSIILRVGAGSDLVEPREPVVGSGWEGTQCVCEMIIRGC